MSVQADLAAARREYLTKRSPFELSHYPVLPDSIDINWGVQPPPSIESINQRKIALYRMEEYGVLT